MCLCVRVGDANISSDQSDINMSVNDTANTASISNSNHNNSNNHTHDMSDAIDMNDINHNNNIHPISSLPAADIQPDDDLDHKHTDVDHELDTNMHASVSDATASPPISINTIERRAASDVPEYVVDTSS